MLTVILIIAGCMAATACVVAIALDIRRARQKREAPEASVWSGNIGFQIMDTSIISETLELARRVETFLGVKMKPIVIVFVAGPIVLSDGKTACGLYHTDDEWTHPWIEVSTGFGMFAPQTIADTALEHELLHHASGIGDTAEFRDLFARYSAGRVK
jgi:hypothetical protein